MKTMVFDNKEIQVVELKDIPRSYEKWNIGKNAPDGYELYAKFDYEKHMEEYYKILAVKL